MRKSSAAVAAASTIVAAGVVAGFVGVVGDGDVTSVAGLAGVASSASVASTGQARALQADSAAIARAASDYAEALYNVEPFRIERSVHPDLAKRGFFRDRDGEWVADLMTYQELYELAGTWNADRRVSAEASPWQVTVLEILDQTATARVAAHWGIDHLQLARYDGRWKIVHVLWQEAPSR